MRITIHTSLDSWTKIMVMNNKCDGLGGVENTSVAITWGSAVCAQNIQHTRLVGVQIQEELVDGSHRVGVHDYPLSVQRATKKTI
jgi:hypothetical protein